ncbi:flagellar export protein FliJ, partial [Noviherbaspirillum cavernae]
VRATEDAEQKLAMLMQYREDYVLRFQVKLSAGVSASGYRNFQQFLDKLDEAIKGQQRVVQDATRRVGNERTAWQGCERKRMSYDILAERTLKVQQLKESRRDQKQTDEFAARQLLYKR